MTYVLLNCLKTSIKKLKSYSKLPYLSRTFYTCRILGNGNYEGDGKTTVTILNREYKYLIMIDTLSNAGFRLNNGIFVLGPLAAFPRTVLQWNVNTVEDITPDSLSLFCLLQPKLDVLIIGTGSHLVFPNKSALQHLKSKNIATEILPTHQACAIFNFLNAEGRYIAGAFIPPLDVSLYEGEFKLADPVTEIDDYSRKPPPKVQM